MSTWTSKALLAAALVALAACRMTEGGGEGFAFAAKPFSRFAGPPPARMAVAGGSVIVAGPRGFCIDRDASRDAIGASALTVLSACRELGGGMFAPAPTHPAVLTAAVAPGGRLIDVAAAEAGLAAYFASPRGRAALSRSGHAETVEIRESLAEDGVFLLYLTDRAPFSWGAVQPDYWRALLQTGGRMVTVAVLGLPDSPLARDDGLALLREFVAALRISTASPPKPKA